MNNPCPKHVLCPSGTGSDTAGVNYSSEHVDVPEYFAPYYPPVPGYGYYTACQNRCMSLISQEDADLCAQRLGKICLNEAIGGGPGNQPKPTFGNTPQICTEPGTGRLVTVPADVFIADSQDEANAQALSYANKAQKNPRTPPGPTIVPPPSTPAPGLPVNTIPTPVPHPPPHPPAPPASQCKPCDDSSAVSTFSVVCNIPADTQTRTFESPPLKCGQWRFEVVTNDPGSVDDGESYITAYLAASNPARTMVDWGTLADCPQMAWINPCSPGPCTAARTTLQWGFYPGCCSQTSTDCKYAECQIMEDGSHWMPLLIIQYVSMLFTGNSSKKFTVTGTLLAPLPPP